MIQQNLAAARIPRKFHNKSMDTFKARDKKRKTLRSDIQNYIKGFKPDNVGEARRGLLFMGGVGTGKTHLAISILRAVIEKGYTGYYCNVADFLARLRDSYGGDTSYDEMDMIDLVSRVDFLVLDDLGAEKPTDWMRDRLYNIINRRYETNRPVLVTTNLIDIDELEEHVGKRIVSRLCEMCQICDHFPADDWRKREMGL